MGAALGLALGDNPTVGEGVPVVLAVGTWLRGEQAVDECAVGMVAYGGLCVRAAGAVE